MIKSLRAERTKTKVTQDSFRLERISSMSVLLRTLARYAYAQRMMKNTWMMKRTINKLNVPTIPELVEHVSDAGAYLWACQMSVDMLGLTADDFHPAVDDVINVDTFINLSEDAQVLFV